MTRDEITQLTTQALKKVVTEDYPGHAGKLDPWTMCLLERFAALVAAHEREACAKVCEAIYNDPEENNGYDAYYTRPYIECADAIRARGQS